MEVTLSARADMRSSALTYLTSSACEYFFDWQGQPYCSSLRSEPHASLSSPYRIILSSRRPALATTCTRHDHASTVRALVCVLDARRAWSQTPGQAVHGVSNCLPTGRCLTQHNEPD